MSIRRWRGRQVRPGRSFLLGLYLEASVRDVGLSPVDLASIYVVATLCAAIVLPLLGRLLDRYRARAFRASERLMTASPLSFAASPRAAP